LHPGDKITFSILKKEIAAVMKLSFPGIDPDISQWKGQDIVSFQEDLLRKVNGRLSEKWFYTHMKSSAPTLPRIDTLDMLCRYAGYAGWQDFIYKNNGLFSSGEKHSKAIKEVLKISLIFIAVTAAVFFLIKLINTQNYHLTFFDKITGEPVTSDRIRVSILIENETPLQYTADKDGEVVVKTSKGILKMVVTAPYYLPDTIIRSLKKLIRNEKIGLDADSYAMMISYFSDSDVNGWGKRREQLTRILHDNALIYRLSGTNGDSGMELYNKQEFIDKLTMPSSSLRKIEILETRYLDDQIILLRFKLKESNYE
jgi:hypothetical protein